MSLFKNSPDALSESDGWVEKIAVEKKRKKDEEVDLLAGEGATTHSEKPYVSVRNKITQELEANILQWTKDLQNSEKKFARELHIYQRGLEKKIEQARESLEFHEKRAAMIKLKQI